MHRSEEVGDMTSSNLVTQELTKSLVEEIEDNMNGYWSWVFSSPYSKVEDEEEFLRITSETPHPMCNWVCRAFLREKDTGMRIDEIMSVFKSRDLPTSWLVTPSSRPSNLGGQLVSHGFVYHDELDSVGMTIDLRELNEKTPAPEGLLIRRVANDSDMLRYLIPFRDGFELPEFVSTAWGRIDASHGFAARLPRTNYVAMMEGAPVSCTSLFKIRDSAGIYCVATVPEMRRKGAATALIVNALREARDDGYRLGLLQAKAMGAGVYRKIGFVDQPFRIGWYIWQPPDAVQ